MSDDESINSDDVPSDKSSDSLNEEDNQDKALSNLKKTLNLEDKETQQIQADKEQNISLKIIRIKYISLKILL